jgi:hypothetical protein
MFYLQDYKENNDFKFEIPARKFDDFFGKFYDTEAFTDVLLIWKGLSKKAH